MLAQSPPAAAAGEGRDVEKTGKVTAAAVAETAGNHSVFTQPEKWCIVAMVAFAAWFSTVSSFIYFPILTQLADAFGVSIDQINLTVTSYMAVATVAPTLVGDTADVIGRRPVYLLSLGLYVAADICLALAKSFDQILGLRVLQAFGSSGMATIVEDFHVY